MRANARQRRAGLDEAALLEIAHLHCAWRTTRGATHTLNNALTALTGLVDVPTEHGELENELRRCTRVARALTAHHAPRFGRSDEAELGAVVREVATLLEDTLSRRFTVTAESPADLWYVEVDPARVELLALLLAYRLADLAEGDARLRIAAGEGEKPESACLELDVHGDRLAERAAEIALDPDAVADTGAALALDAVLAVAAAAGGAVAARPLPGGVRVRAHFPAISP